MPRILSWFWVSHVVSAHPAPTSNYPSKSRTCHSPWSLLQIHSTKSSHETLNAWENEIMTEVAGGGDQVCRGADGDDNSETYFETHTGLASLAACKELCISSSTSCKGIEYSSDNSGRCEIWTRAKGIGAVMPMSGFTCLQFQQEFEVVDGVSDGACRGATLSDNSADYYTTFSGVESLAECKERCLSTASTCQGIEYTPGLGGRCELWTRAAGIGAVMPLNNFTCLRLRSFFTPVESTERMPAALVTTTAVPADPTTSAAIRILVPQYHLAKGADYDFSAEHTQDISLVGMTKTSALVCSVIQRHGSCIVLLLSNGTLEHGTKVGIAEQREITRLTVARLSEAAALACYVEHGVGPLGRPMPDTTCRVLLVSGSAVMKGAPFILDDQEEAVLSLSVTGLSPALAMVCYDRLDDMGLTGICSSMHVSGTTLEQGQEVELSAGDIDYGPETVVARLSDTAALVCYRDQHHYERAACNVLALSGGETLKGPVLPISDSHFHSLSAAGMSATKAAVCFKDFSLRPAQSICKELAISGTSLQDVQQVPVPTGKTSLARISENAALVCSSDTHHTHMTSCAVLSFGDQTVTKGPDLKLSTSNTGSFYVTAGISSTDGLVCHAKAHRGTCTALSISAASS